MARVLLGAIDLGTTSTRFSLFARNGASVASKSQAIKQIYPSHGWHEQNPNEYLTATLSCIDQVMQQADAKRGEVACIGITNQRETTVVWDKETGEPLHNAIIWDDTRTHKYCETLQDHAPKMAEITGLVVNPYFSASKMRWLIDHVPAVKAAVNNRTARFGTAESWLVYKLTKEKKHLTDISNASRTLLMSLDGKWDASQIETFGIPALSLPEITHNTANFGSFNSGLLEGVPITGCIGDQFASTIGHLCIEPGSCKNTYGTGSFLLLNTGNQLVKSRHGLLTTVIGQFGPSQPITYGLEGSVEAAGSCLNWFTRELGIVKRVEELEDLANSVPDAGDVFFVPALSGLYAPHWDATARGCILGLTQHTTKAHIARAVLEGICYRTAEGIHAIGQDYGSNVKTLSVDGGLTANAFLMKTQAALSSCRIRKPEVPELTCLGAALTAGIGAGVYDSLHDVKKSVELSESFIDSPIDARKRNEMWSRWHKAVERAKHWAQ